ncbi:MAG: hypothetical protein ABJC33_07675 [Betaproteobacteria bacterium]
MKISQLSGYISLANAGTAMMDVGNQRTRTTRRRPSVSPAAAIAYALTEAFDPDKPIAVQGNLPTIDREARAVLAAVCSRGSFTIYSDALGKRMGFLRTTKLNFEGWPK